MLLPESALVLTPADRGSALWGKLKAHYDRKLHTLRCRNDGSMDEAKRNKMLGQIAEVKAFLALDEELTKPAAP